MTTVGVLADSRAMLIGIGLRVRRLPDPRGRNSLQAMHDLLLDPALCGWLSSAGTSNPSPYRLGVIPDAAKEIAECVIGPAKGVGRRGNQAKDGRHIRSPVAESRLHSAANSGMHTWLR